MRALGTTLALAAAFLFLAAPHGRAAASAQDPDSPSARGQVLLERGDLDGALEAFGEAARAPDATQAVQQKFMLLRRTVRLRQALPEEKDPERWWVVAETLRDSYYSLRVYGELLGVTRQMHARRRGPDTATFLADALLLVHRSREAQEVLEEFEPAQLGAPGQLLLGLALGRQEKTQPARALLAGIDLGAKPPPRLLFDLARLKVLCGDVDGGLETLAAALRATSPQGAMEFRAFVRAAPELAGLLEDARFVAVLKTECASGESACSAGPDCGTCPDKDDCESGGG